MTSAARTITSSSSTAAQRRIDRAIEASWLAAIVTTALLFHGRTFFFHFTQPKQNVLHLFALAIVCLWVLDFAFSRDGLAGRQLTWRFWEWAGRNPARWLVVGVGAFSVAQVLATVFSPLPFVSTFGRDLNDPGYELYSGLSYSVIFTAVALRINSKAQVGRLLLTVAATGTATAAYGVSQHFGWDPIGYAANEGRVPGSFGNPIFFASFLVMSTFATVTALLMYRKREVSWWFWGTGLSLGLQVSALWFTGSRGPLVGLLAGAVVLVALGLLTLERRQLGRLLAIGLIGSAVGLVIILLPAPETTGGRSGRAIIASILGQAAASTGSDVSLSGESLATDNVGNRADIWAGAFELLRTRDSIEQPGAYVRFLRHVFGYGPDMYYYSYPLTAPARSKFELVSHAHNFPLQVWLEYGLLGLLTLAGLAAAATIALLRLIWGQWRGGGSSTTFMTVLSIGLAALLAARVVEQMPGVARVGDLTVFWAMVGLVVAAYRLRGEADAVEAPQSTKAMKQVSNKRPSSQADQYRPLWIGGALGLAVLAAFLWGFVDGKALYASRLAAMANHQLNLGDAEEAYPLIKDAAELDTYSEVYGMVASELERDAADNETNPQDRLDILLVAYSTLGEYEQTVPWAVNNDLRLTSLTAAIAELGVQQARGELWDRARDLDFRMRPYPKVMAFVANAYVSLGELELGVETAEYAIEQADSVGVEVAQAWWVRGEALGRLDRMDEALESLITATEVAPESQFAINSHRTLAQYYEEQGDTEEAQRHRDRADEIEQSNSEET